MAETYNTVLPLSSLATPGLASQGSDVLLRLLVQLGYLPPQQGAVPEQAIDQSAQFARQQMDRPELDLPYSARGVDSRIDAIARRGRRP
jgi:hypothetical protein